MKKLIAFLLAAILCLSMGITAWADGEEGPAPILYDVWLDNGQLRSDVVNDLETSLFSYDGDTLSMKNNVCQIIRAKGDLKMALFGDIVLTGSAGYTTLLLEASDEDTTPTFILSGNYSLTLNVPSESESPIVAAEISAPDHDITASTNIDGSNPVTYNPADQSTYKYVKFTPKSGGGDPNPNPNPNPNPDPNPGDPSDYPYGQKMKYDEVTLVAPITGDAEVVWKTSATKDSGYEEINGEDGKTITLKEDDGTLIDGNWYLYEVGGKASLPVQLLSYSGENNYFTNTDGYWFVSNGNIAYSVWNDSNDDEFKFDVAGKYVKNGKTYWISSSYNGEWEIGSHTAEEAKEPIAGGSFGNDNLKSLILTFNKDEAQAVIVSAEIAEGYSAMAFGTDTQISNSSIAGEYADDCSLKGIFDENGTLKQIQMVGAESLANAEKTDPAFVFTTVTEPSYYWIGEYYYRQAYAYNTRSVAEENQSSYIGYYKFDNNNNVVEMNDEDSGMTVSWTGLNAGDVVQFKMSLGSVGDTGAILPEGDVTSISFDADDGYVYKIVDEEGKEIEGFEDWVKPGEDGKVIFIGLNPNTPYIIISVLDENNDGEPDEGATEKQTQAHTDVFKITPATAELGHGGTQEFGTNAPEGVVVAWSVNSEKSTVVNGLLTVGAEETATELTVTAKITIAGTEHTATAAVYVLGEDGVFTISPDTATVKQGGTQQFTASISGDEVPAEEVDWVVWGEKAMSNGTKVENGLLTVGADEQNTELKVYAYYLEFEELGRAARGGGYVYSDWADVTVTSDTTEPEPDPEPEEPAQKPSKPCDHRFDDNNKCEKCGVIIINHVEKPADEENPNTGAPVGSARGQLCAAAAILVCASLAFGAGKGFAKGKRK